MLLKKAAKVANSKLNLAAPFNVSCSYLR